MLQRMFFLCKSRIIITPSTDKILELYTAKFTKKIAIYEEIRRSFLSAYLLHKATQLDLVRKRFGLPLFTFRSLIFACGIVITCFYLLALDALFETMFCKGRNSV